MFFSLSQIAETYSFLPREAVTRFLMSCADCQKRMHLSLENNNNDSHVAEDPPIIDFSLPITTTYLNHMRTKKGYMEEPFYPQEPTEDREVRCPHTFFLADLFTTFLDDRDRLPTVV